MNTDVTMDGISATSPRVKARIAGLLYLLAFLTGILAQGFVSGTLLVDGDAGATAANIIFKSTLLPRILGVVSMVAAVGWLTFLYPPLGYRLFFSTLHRSACSGQLG